MNSMEEALTNFKTLGPQIRRFLAVLDEIEKIPSVDRAVAESEGRLAKARADEASGLAEIDRKRGAAEHYVSVAQSEGDRQIAAARTTVAELEAKAVKLRAEIKGLNSEAELARKKLDALEHHHAEFLERVSQGPHR